MTILHNFFHSICFAVAQDLHITPYRVQFMSQHFLYNAHHYSPNPRVISYCNVEKASLSTVLTGNIFCVMLTAVFLLCVTYMSSVFVLKYTSLYTGLYSTTF